MTGKPLQQALSIMVPESWNDKNPISPELKAFFEYYSCFMEPWDGPASIIFCDGRYVGGLLDRNGLRPSRYIITRDDIMVMGSEVGVQVFPAEDIIEKGRLKPGKMLIVDTKEGRIIHNEELKNELQNKKPYRQWLDENLVSLEDIQFGKTIPSSIGANYPQYLKAFGYNREDMEMLLLPMAQTGYEPVSSMGNDVPLPAFSKMPYRLFNYFRQIFAQVTNPAIDPIREELVMTLTGYIGSLRGNLLEDAPEHCKRIKFKSPVINNTTFEILRTLQYKGFQNSLLHIHYDVKDGGKGLETALDNLCKQAESAVDDGSNYIILSDRGIDKDKAAIPILLAVAAVHHYLIRKRKRLQVDIVAETADAREVTHFALLFGYGASIINPYMAFAVIDDLIQTKKLQSDQSTAEENYIHAINKGVLKILSKMGTSTLRSYRGAQIFEGIGLDQKMVDKYFTGTESRIGGIGLDEIAEEMAIPHRAAYDISVNGFLLNPGYYQYRIYGEKHAWNPETVALLQWSTKTGDYQKFKEYTATIDSFRKKDPIFIRDFLKVKRSPIDITKVESADQIMRRFFTGAMSYGSISKEAHEALAIAMNSIGGRSNSGEGGEDPERFKIRADGSNPRSAVKQVASGRFGVTANYLVNADEIQIKISQGAKPGEGGQLPGHKIDKIIARTRHSTPGITLISPPPHHDIYSIEDLKQLIFDLKNVNPRAEISVKLVSEAGVGTVAAGVAKACADRILISGCEGGTGASPISSIKHAGMPMELGISETQQTLVMNGLRGKVTLQTDGQLKTGRDVVIAGLLGGEEFGFATSALIVLGCVMMRKCHLNTCPVGVATQDPELRARFVGRSEYVVNYFRFLAEEAREILAQMGFEKFDDIIGRTDLLEVDTEVEASKTHNLDFSKILYYPAEAKTNATRHMSSQDHKIDKVLDRKLIEMAQPAILKQEKVVINQIITNVDRSTGAMLSGEIAKRYAEEGLPEDTILCNLKGSAGQSFGAFLAKGITFRLEGDSNDYLGKGLSGGRISVVPPKGSMFKPEENIIIGNTVLYGATSGECYINGIGGERFAVRNSGATAVIEGVGDHGCEYMTGGRVVVLGKTGRNFAAGMSGGVAYVLNEQGNFDYYCNMGMVELSLVDNSDDSKELKSLIEKHFANTGSDMAKKILNAWSEFLPKFIKVIPYEYKKVLEEQKLAALKEKMQVLSHE